MCGSSGSPGDTGYILPVPDDGREYTTSSRNAPILQSHDSATIQVSLPRDLKAELLAWVAVWYRRGSIDLGSVILRPAQGPTQGFLEIAAVEAEEEEYEEEYGEYGGEYGGEDGGEYGGEYPGEDGEVGLVEEEEGECPNWRPGSSQVGVRFARICYPQEGELNDIEEEEEEKEEIEEEVEEEEKDEMEEAVEEEEKEDDKNCVEISVARFGHNLAVYKGVESPYKCWSLCQSLPLCQYWNHRALTVSYPWESRCHLKAIRPSKGSKVSGYTGGSRSCKPTLHYKTSHYLPQPSYYIPGSVLHLPRL